MNPGRHVQISAAAVVLSQFAGTYPESGVRAIASDTTQVFIATALITATPLVAHELLELIPLLAPQDRLLARDCDRYVRQRQQATTRRKIPNPKTRGIKRVHTGSLTQQIDWRIARSTESSVYIAGYSERSLFLRRLEWKQLGKDGPYAMWSGVNDQAALILEPHPLDLGPAILHQIGVEPLPYRRLSAGQEKWSFAGSPSSATATTVAMAHVEGGRSWRVRHIFESLELVITNTRGEITFIKDLQIPFHDRDIDSISISLFASSRMVRLGIGSYLCRLRQSPDKNPLEELTIDLEPLPSVIKGLAGYQSEPSGKKLRLLATFETGCLLFDEVNGNSSPVGSELESPTATFLTGGQFAVAGAGEVQAYEIAEERPVLIGTAKIDFAPISVTTTDKISQFAVFGGTGEFQIFSIDR